MYEKSIMAIERELNLKFEICSHLQANSEDYLKKVNKKSARHVMRQFSKYAIFVWIVATIIFADLFIYSTFLTCR